MTFTKFTNCNLIDNGEVYAHKDLYIDNETHKIVETPDPSKVTEVIDLEGQYLAPGFLDLQNNGIYGVSFSNINSESTDQEVAMFQAKYNDAMTKYLSTGVTGMCPTLPSTFPKVYKKVLPLYKKTHSTEKCDSLGAHLEGPFINLKKGGCHPREAFVDAKGGKDKLYNIYGGQENFDNVAIVTAAPEIPGVLDLIPELKSKHITFSIGHTMTDYETGLKAVENGATMITHLYNAMPQPHHRDVGVIGLINLPSAREIPSFGLICDGVHIDPSMCALAYKSNPEKCFLVTDAMHLIGLADGTYKWDDQYIVKEGYRLVLKGTNTLAGAATTLPACVRNLMHWTGISLAEAVKTVTNNPAKAIGLESKGHLNPGCDADLVVLNKDGYVQSIYKLGNKVKSTDAQLGGSKDRLLAAL